MERIDIEGQPAVSVPSAVYVADGDRKTKSSFLIFPQPSWINNSPFPLISTNLKCLQPPKQNGKASRKIQEKGKEHL